MAAPLKPPPVLKQGKYKSSGRLHRWFNERFMRGVADSIRGISCDRVLDIGCGEGLPLLRLKPHLGNAELHGIDSDAEAVELISRNIAAGHFIQGSAYELPFPDKHFDLVLCLEALEHMDRPEKAPEEIARVSRGLIILSVPCEPWWGLLNILRLKYLSRGGNPPEHVQRWTRRGFRRLVSGFLPVAAVRSVLPWTILIGETAPGIRA